MRLGTETFRAFNKVYRKERTIKTNVSVDYLNDAGTTWTLWEAFRESVQNLMDEAEYHKRRSDRWDAELPDFCSIGRVNIDGQIWIRLADKGRGVDLEKIFLIGESGKRGQDYRGQKGEGEILSFLVCVRESVGKWMFSQNWAVTGRFVPYNGSDEYMVLALDVYKTSAPITGTEWRFELKGRIEYFAENLGEFFPDLSRREIRRQRTASLRRAEEDDKYYRRSRRERQAKRRSKSTTSTKCILTPRNGRGPRLYNKGIFVRELEDETLFSYNLDTTSINRDRDMVDSASLSAGIAYAFNSEDVTFSQMVTYWENSKRNVNPGIVKGEYLYALEIKSERNREMMVRAFYKAFGSKKTCLFTDNFAAVDAVSMGWTVVTIRDSAHKTAVDLGIGLDWLVAGYTQDGMQPMKRISKKIQRQIEKFGELVEEMGWPVVKIVPVNRLAGDSATKAVIKKDTMWVVRDAWEGASFDLLKTLVHETAHADSDAGDADRRFADWAFALGVRGMAGLHSDKLVELTKEFLAI